MATIKIICPGCKSNFILKAPSLQGMVSKTFRCPKCGLSTSFGQLLSRGGQQPPLRTRIGGTPGMAPPAHNSTRIANNVNGKLVLEVKELGRVYPLGEGTYTIGRESGDSRASLKIAPDRYMSRQQAVLEIRPSSSFPGSPLTARISNISTTTPIYVNETKLETGQSANIKNGDLLLLGMTKVTVKL